MYNLKHQAVLQGLWVSTSFAYLLSCFLFLRALLFLHIPLFFNLLILFHVCNTFSYFSEDIKGSFGHFPPLPPWSCFLQVVCFDHCISWQVLRCLRILGWLIFKSGALKKLVGVLGSLIGGWGRGFWLLNVDPAVESDLSCLFTLGAPWCLCLWVFSIRLVSFSKERSFKKWNGCQGSGSWVGTGGWETHLNINYYVMFT